MALMKSEKFNIPEDAVVLTEEQALRYQAAILLKWKPESDVWAIKYGKTILAAVAAISGAYINSYYRNRFRLFNYGRMATYLPLCVIPSVTALVLHSEFVLPDVILQKECPVCTEIRASAFQAGMGCVFPTMLAPIAVFSLAIRYNTYDIPYLNKPVQVFKFWQKHTKPIGNILFGIFLAQAAVAAVVTYLEAKAIITVNNKLTLSEYDLQPHM